MTFKRLKTLTVVLTVMLAILVAPANAASTTFTDVPDGAWYKPYVEYCYENGLMNGTSSTEFAPSMKMSRAMLVTVLHRIAGKPVATKNHPFTDVADGSWYEDAVAWASESGVVNGTSKTTFSPDADISREAMVTIFYRYAKSEGYDVSATNALSGYPDKASVSSWAKTAMQWAVAEGIINGVGDQGLAPQGNTTRAECATVIQRFMLWTANDSSDDTSDTEDTDSSGGSAEAGHTHSYVASSTVKPTCTTGGYTVYTCSCGDSYTGSKTGAAGHNYEASVKAATCTEGGYTTHTCSGCGSSYVSDWTAPAGHPCTDTVIAPTCEADGYTLHTCTVCGFAYTDTDVDALGHDHQLLSTVPATCDEGGTATYKCSRCDDSYTVPVEKLGHDWVYTHVDEVGHYENTHIVCRCGWSCTKEEALALGYSTPVMYWSEHHYEYYSKNRNSINDHFYTSLVTGWTVDTPRVDTWACSRCDAETSDHDSLEGHEMFQTVIGSASCHRGSEDVYKCLKCEYTYACNYQECLGHNWGEWVISEPVTEDSRGWAIRTCQKCSYDMGDYADLVAEHYCSYKPESGHVCLECGKDSVEN